MNETATNADPRVLQDDIRHLIVADTQLSLNGFVEMPWSLMERLNAREWTKAVDDGEYVITDAGRAVIDRVLAVEVTDAMVERGARAICRQAHINPDEPFKSASGEVIPSWEVYSRTARAAIAANLPGASHE